MFKIIKSLETGYIIEFQRKIYYASTFNFFEYKKGQIERVDRILCFIRKKYFADGGGVVYKIVGLFLPDFKESDIAMNILLHGINLRSVHFVLEKK